jgi:ABC-type glycerol-3-phosphate transport system permease component
VDNVSRSPRSYLPGRDVMRLFYTFGIVLGAISMPLSLPISLYVGRGEPLVPLLAMGPALILFSGYWQGLRDKNPVYLAGRKSFRLAIPILAISIIINSLAATLGTAFRLGTSTTYLTLMFAGLILPLVGAFLGIVGNSSGKKMVRSKPMGKTGHVPFA